MTRQTVLAGYRLAFGALTLVAAAYQLSVLLDADPDYRVANFFSFFTIESNLFAAGLLLYLGLRRSDGGANQGRLDLIRGAATLYMGTTGVVYSLLLSGYTAELDTAVIWVNNVVHRIMPVVMVLDWLVDPPRTALTLRRALVWLVFPLAYLAYTLVRGPIVDSPTPSSTPTGRTVAAIPASRSRRWVSRSGWSPSPGSSSASRSGVAARTSAPPWHARPDSARAVVAAPRCARFPPPTGDGSTDLVNAEMQATRDGGDRDIMGRINLRRWASRVLHRSFH